MSSGPLLAVPGAEQGGLDFAAMRALEQADGGLAIGGADRAPAGTRGDRRDQPALVGIAVQQQQRPGALFGASPVL